MTLQFPCFVLQPETTSREIQHIFGVQGWRSGESIRLPPMWPGFDSQIRRHMWVEFVGFSSLHREVFSGNSGFPSPQKPKFDLIVLIINFSYSVPNLCSSARRTRHLNKVPLSLSSFILLYFIRQW